MPRGTETILVVEDEPQVRGLVSQILEAQGYRVLEAANGGEALELVAGSAARPELLLTALVMPGLDGQEVARRMRAELPGLKVLLMSGYGDRQVAAHSGGARLLQKPFASALLARAVRAALDNPSYETPPPQLPATV